MLCPDFHTHQVKRHSLISLSPDKWANRENGAGYFYSLQLHPWYEHSIEELEEFARLLPEADAAGELGLDRKSLVAWDKQLYYFEHALRNACKFDKPVVIHEVKASSEVITLLKKYSPRAVMIHHFSGNSNKLATYQRLNYQISYKSFPSSGALPPIELLGLESDDSDSESDLVQLYRKFAEAYCLDEAKFIQRLQQNFNNFIGK